MPLRIAVAFLLVLLGCAPLVQRDLRLEYFAQTRAIGMTPVYPPRGEVQVGDVYLIYTPASGGVDEATSLYMGRMGSMRQQALAYLSSRDNIGALMPSGTSTGDLTGMKELPAVNFPTITGSAASSASLGAIAPVFSGVFSVGSLDTVSMKFVDVRAFGVPFLSALIDSHDFHQTVCPVLLDRKSKLYRQLGYTKVPEDMTAPCADTDAMAKGQRCDVHIVTRTYLTRQIQFTYNQKRRLGASGSAARPLPAAAPVAPVPSVSVNIDANTPPNTATAVIDALKAPTNTSTSSVGAAVVSETSQGLAFDQSFKDPLAVAYESVTVPILDAARLCSSLLK
ncbi:hypothetical protein [Rhodobacter sp. SY28-1]|uniref:hypothetical protein n=1 Tax=Rhodobacter sp. SY28-1 TaxID=2562317 RepID=UPI0010C05C9D|nr:hypothetical protein [Rhodobacter sp. SY28-1]